MLRSNIFATPLKDIKRYANVVSRQSENVVHWSCPELYLNAMYESATIEMKCDCPIPFHTELLYLIKDIFVHGKFSLREKTSILPDGDVVVEALKGRPIFLNIGFKRPVKKIKPFIIKALQSLFKKDVVAIMKIGEDDFTLIFY